MKTRVSGVLVLVVGMILLLVLSVNAQRSKSSVVAAANSSGVQFVSQVAGSARGLAVQGDYVYVADKLHGLRVINISNPAAPTEAGFSALLDFADNVAVSGNYAYVADGLSGLRIFNVSNPAAPSQVGVYTTTEVFYAQDVTVMGGYAYVADALSGLRIIDVSNSAAPFEVASYATPDHASYGVMVSGKYAYVAAWTSGLRVVDVSNLANLNETGFYDTSGSAQDVAVAGDYAYVADYNGGLRIIDVSDPENLTETGFYDTAGLAQGVAIAKNNAYVADEAGGLRIVDFSNPITPTEEAFYETVTGKALDVAVVEGYVYVADENDGLLVLYFAPPSSTSVSEEGGELVSSYDDTSYEFPPGTFTDTVIITHTPRFASDVPALGNLVGIGHFFEVTAVYSSTGLPAQPAPGHTYTMSVQYAPHELGIATENTLKLYYWNGERWVADPTSSLNQVTRTVVATPDHFSIWAVLGETQRIFLPLISKNQ